MPFGTGSAFDTIERVASSPTTGVLIDRIVSNIEEEMPDAPGKEKKREAAKRLAKTLDDALDFTKIIPHPVAGAVVELIDGFVFRLVFGPLIEAAVRGLKPKPPAKGKNKQGPPALEALLAKIREEHGDADAG